MVQDLNCPVVKGMVAFASLRSAMNAHAMGDMELPEDASVVQDFKKLHDLDVSELNGIAIMTDTDNSKQKAVAYYQNIYFSSE